VTRDNEDSSSKLPPPDEDEAAQRVSDRRLAMFFVALAAALVLGYLLLSKLADMSQEEDCALAHRRNCEAGDLSTTRLANVDAAPLGAA
jgi:hypothetical protein